MGEHPLILETKGKKCFLVALTLMASLQCSVGNSQTIPRHVSITEAEELVKAALPAKTKRLPQFGLEQFQDHSARFYFFTAYWAGLPGGSMVVGNYAVDPSTGDVWDAVIECGEQDAPALRKLQKRIRARIGLSDSQYRSIKSKGPLC